MLSCVPPTRGVARRKRSYRGAALRCAVLRSDARSCAPMRGVRLRCTEFGSDARSYAPMHGLRLRCAERNAAAGGGGDKPIAGTRAPREKAPLCRHCAAAATQRRRRLRARGGDSDWMRHLTEGGKPPGMTRKHPSLTRERANLTKKRETKPSPKTKKTKRRERLPLHTPQTLCRLLSPAIETGSGPGTGYGRPRVSDGGNAKPGAGRARNRPADGSWGRLRRLRVADCGSAESEPFDSLLSPTISTGGGRGTVAWHRESNRASESSSGRGRGHGGRRIEGRPSTTV